MFKGRISTGLVLPALLILCFSVQAGVMGYDLTLNMSTGISEPDTISMSHSVSGELTVRLTVTLTNDGDETSSPGSLLVVLPIGNLVSRANVIYYDIGFSPNIRTSNPNYWFDIDNIPASASRRAIIEIVYRADEFPFDYDTTDGSAEQCTNIHTHGYFWSDDGFEYEEYSENTVFCKWGGSSFPDLIINKQIDTTDCIGDSIVYIINYENVGDAPASNVVIVDHLPEGASFVSASVNPIASSRTRPPLIWDSSVIPALSSFSGSGTIMLTVDINSVAQDEWANTVTIQTTDPEDNLSNNADQVIATCDMCYDLRTEIEVTPNIARCGEQFCVYFKVTNVGGINIDNVLANVTINNAEAVGLNANYNFPLGTRDAGSETTWTICGDAPDNPNIGAFSDGITITLNVTPTADDCDASDNTVSLNIRYECEVGCGNCSVDTRIITPNGDGMNDEAHFYPPGITKVIIYDADGYKVRELKPPEVFDGRDDEGRPLPSGTYIWQIYCPLGENTPRYGSTIAIQR